MNKFINNIKFVFIVALFAGIFLRTSLLFKPFSGTHSWNEGYYSMIAANFDKYGIGNQMSYRGKDLSVTPLVPCLIYFSTRVFGNSEWAARFPAYIFGILSLVLLYLAVSELFDKKIAAVAMLFAAVAPGIVYYSRNIQLESPSVFFILASIYLFIRSPGIAAPKGFFNTYSLLSLVFAAAAVFVKYNNIFLLLPVFVLHVNKMKASGGINPGKNVFKLLFSFAAYSFIAVLPVAAWIAFAAAVTGGGNKWYFWRPQEWSFSGILYGLFRTPATIGDHLNFFVYVFSVAGIVNVFREWRNNLFLIAYILPWFFPLFIFPEAYIRNRYYDYPALYGLAVCASIGFFRFDKLKIRNIFFILGIITAIGATVLAYFKFEESCFNSAMAEKYNETSFYSAKYVAGARKGGETVVVGWPAEMYYAGSDPEFIKCSFDDTRKFIASEKYDYVVLNYSRFAYEIDGELLERFRRHNYTRVAPFTWKKNGQ